MKRTITVLSLLLLLSGGGIAGAVRPELYIHPKGSNADGDGTRAKPWRTVVHACAPARCPVGGCVINMQDGTYPPQGQLNPTVCRQGTPKEPVTIRAESRYRAHIRGANNDVDRLLLQDLEYYVIEGLRLSNGRFKNYPHSILRLSSVRHVTVRKNLFHEANRLANSHLARITASSDVLFEDNEGYNFHRHGFDFSGGGTRNTARGNYLHGWIVPNEPGDYVGHAGATDMSDEILVTYPGTHHTFESNITERGEFGARFIPDFGGVGNRAIGNIFYRPQICFGLDTRENSVRGMEVDAVARENVCIQSQSVGTAAFHIRTPKNFQSANNTIIAPKGGGIQVYGTATARGDGEYSLTSVNDLIIGSPLAGMHMTPQMGNLAFTIDFPGFSGNQRPTNLIAGHPRVTNAELRASQLGIARVCVPRHATRYAGKGSNGADRGANAQYRFVDGDRTTTPRFTRQKPDAAFPNSASGWYPTECGPRVPGVNDIPGQSCYDAADRVIASKAALATAVLQSCNVPGHANPY